MLWQVVGRNHCNLGRCSRGATDASRSVTFVFIHSSAILSHGLDAGDGRRPIHAAGMGFLTFEYRRSGAESRTSSIQRLRENFGLCNSHGQRGQDSKGLGINERRNHLHLGPTPVRIREQLISLEYGFCTLSRQHKGYSEALETQRVKDLSSPSLRSTVAEEQQVTTE